MTARSPSTRSWARLVRGFWQSLRAEGVGPTATRLRHVLRARSAPRVPLPRDVLLVSGCPGHPRRYRCEHAVEQLRSLGLDAAVFHLPAPRSVEGIRALVLQRVPWDCSIEDLVDSVRRGGGRILYEVDDLVFDPSHIEELANARLFDADNPRARELYRTYLTRCRQALDACDAVIVSTIGLADEVRRLCPDRPVHVLRNAVGEAMIAAAEGSRGAGRSGPTRVGYFAGSPTHDTDLESIAIPLLEVLGTRPDVELLLVGPVRMPAPLRQLGAQVRREGAVPWQRLPELLRGVDLHLAPLAPGQRFTAVKSEIKFLEAALVARPLVASRRGGFAEVVRDGVDGRLCDTPDQWSAALGELLDDPVARRRIGLAAEDRVLSSETNKARAAVWSTILELETGGC